MVLLKVGAHDPIFTTSLRTTVSSGAAVGARWPCILHNCGTLQYVSNNKVMLEVNPLNVITLYSQ